MPFTSIKVGGPASIRLAQRLGLKGKGAIAARLRFAHQHKLEAVAVGAEDEATMSGLAEVGFTAAQGIWIQKPMPLDDLLKWNGNWARGRVSMEPVPVAPARSAAQPRREQPAQRSEPKPVTDEAPKVVSKEEMQMALEAVRAKRGSAPHVQLQAKSEHKAAPPLPVMDPSELEDIVEDEEVSAPPVKQQGFGATGDSCPPMKSLVQRRLGQGDGEAAPAVRKPHGGAF
jgi:hypothetical protein